MRDMKNREEIFDIVDSLNEIWWDNQDDNVPFELSYRCGSMIISFMGQRIWFEDEDEREFIENKNDYEPLQPFLEKKARGITKLLFKRLFNELYEELDTLNTSSVFHYSVIEMEHGIDGTIIGKEINKFFNE